MALVRSLLLVDGDEHVEGPLDLLGCHILGRAALHAEAPLEQREVHALGEAVGLRAAPFGRLVLDVLDGERIS